MNRIIPLRLFGTILLLAGASGCGKVGSLDTPPNSTYPKVYPAAAVHQASRVQNGPSAKTASFTPNGAWIDPNLRLPNIDPYADVDHSTTGGASPQSQ